MLWWRKKKIDLICQDNIVYVGFLLNCFDKSHVLCLQDGKEGIVELINSKLTDVEEKDREEIISYIVKHFEDPTAYEKARLPRARRPRRSRSGEDKKEDNKENSASEDVKDEKEDVKPNGN